MIEVKILRKGDEFALKRLADGVFDRGIDARLTAEFLADHRHHLAVAIDGDAIVGFASAVHYVHPDKPAELWINEVGVSPKHRQRGLGRRLMQALLEVGKTLGCREAWVLTDRTNIAAMSLYKTVGGTEAPRDQVMFSFKLD